MTVSTPMWIEEEARYKMVYESRPPVYKEENFRWVLAVFRDGQVWKKPNLGAVAFNGSKGITLLPSPENKRLWQVVRPGTIRDSWDTAPVVPWSAPTLSTGGSSMSRPFLQAMPVP